MRIYTAAILFHEFSIRCIRERVLNHVRVILLQVLAVESLTNENENTAYVHGFSSKFQG